MKSLTVKDSILFSCIQLFELVTTWSRDSINTPLYLFTKSSPLYTENISHSQEALIPVGLVKWSHVSKVIVHRETLDVMITQSACMWPQVDKQFKERELMNLHMHKLWHNTLILISDQTNLSHKITCILEILCPVKKTLKIMSNPSSSKNTNTTRVSSSTGF